jgi:hypothetical protein
MYCERFSGKDGGQAATNLAYYPLLQEVSGHHSSLIHIYSQPS